MQESKQKYTKQKKTVLYTKQTFATAVSFRVCLESRERHQSLSKCVGVCVPIRVQRRHTKCQNGSCRMASTAYQLQVPFGRYRYALKSKDYSHHQNEISAMWNTSEA